MRSTSVGSIISDVRVEDLMTTDVVTVAPDTPLREVADALIEHRISGAPVRDADGRIVGVVSQSDIIWKELRMAPETGGPIARLLDRAYGDDQRTSAITAADAMTSPAIAIEPDASVASAARSMIEHLINRLPVVADGRLVGILTRSDLVRAFSRPDAEIEREIRDDVLDALCVDPVSLWLMVKDGDAVIGGEVENHSTATSIERRIRSIPGVATVRSDLRWEIDDSSRRVAQGAAKLPLRL
jgi:CBS domain-containing protein